MPAKKHSKSTQKSTTSDKDFSKAVLLEMYHLHLALLVVLSILSAVLCVYVIKQQYHIRNLEFRLNFMDNRYQILRDREDGRAMQREIDQASESAGIQR